jgi:hypothetical protein
MFQSAAFGISCFAEGSSLGEFANAIIDDRQIEVMVLARFGRFDWFGLITEPNSEP